MTEQSFTIGKTEFVLRNGLLHQIIDGRYTFKSELDTLWEQAEAFAKILSISYTSSKE